MKKTIPVLAAAAFVALLLPVTALVSAQDLTPFQVMDKARANWQGDTFHGLVTLDVTQGAQSRSYRVEVWSQGETLGLIRFLAPAADAGSGYLMDGDDLWYYAPAAGKAVSLPKMALSDSLFGSGPALEDLLHGTLSEDYEATMTRDGTDYLLTLTPKPQAPVVYGHLAVRIREDFAIVSIDYVDQRGAVLRTAKFSEYLNLPGRIVATLIVVEEKNGDRSVERLEKPEFNVAIDPKLFTVEYLEAGK
jgi:outer membrane lipoprotein-sorting protein